MPIYLVKKKGRIIDYIPVPLPLARTELIKKWLKRGYKKVYARNFDKAIEIAFGLKVVKRKLR